MSVPVIAGPIWFSSIAHAIFRSDSSKTSKTLGFLRRNFSFASRETKEVAYKTLMRSKLEYAAAVWNPYIKIQCSQLEKVQRTCRRLGNTSYVDDMVDELQWPTLKPGGSRLP